MELGEERPVRSAVASHRGGGDLRVPVLAFGVAGGIETRGHGDSTQRPRAALASPAPRWKHR